MKNRMFIGKQRRRSTDMLPLHAVLRMGYEAWRFEHRTDVAVICEQIAKSYFAGGLHEAQDNPVLRETTSAAAIASNRSSITRWFSKDTPDARSTLADISSSIFNAMPRDLSVEMLNFWLGPAGFVVNAINEHPATPHVPDFNVKLGSFSKEYGEAIDASLRLPVNDLAPAEEIRTALSEVLEALRAGQHVAEHLEHMLAERSRLTTGNRSTDKRPS